MTKKKERRNIAGIRQAYSVSWSRAYQDGMMIAIHNKIFTLIVAFSVICERSISLFASLTGVGIDQVFVEYRDFLINSMTYMDFTSPLPFPGFLFFLPIAAVLFLMGAFLLVGILGLIRDLLIRKGYRAQEVFIRGREYFWPIFKFKATVYIINSVFIAIAAPPLLSFDGSKGDYLLWLSVALFFFFVFFVVTSVALSLGSKIIVVEGSYRVLDVYRRIIEIVKPAIRQTAIFYTLMMGIVAIGILVPWEIARLRLPSMMGIILSIFFIAFVAVIMKVSAFYMYLQLSSLGMKATGQQKCIGEYNIT